MKFLIRYRQFISFLLISLLSILTNCTTLFAQQKLSPISSSNNYFYDDFTGNLSRWEANQGYEINNNFLKLNSSVSSPASIQSTIDLKYGIFWEFGLQLDFAPSTSNYIRIYLASNNDIIGSHQGYHLQIDGANNAHTYKIYRQNGSSRSIIFQSDAIANNNSKLKTQVRISRTHEGIWQIKTCEANDNNFITLKNSNASETIKDINYTTFSKFGYSTYFTTTRRTDSYLHYFLIKPYSEKSQINYSSYEWIDNKTLKISFNDILNSNKTKKDLFILQNQTIDSISQKDSIVTLFLHQIPQMKEMNLKISSIYGYANNDLLQEINIPIKFTQQYQAAHKEVVINELMVNPTNSKLPQQEYIEIWNRSEKSFNLQDYSLQNPNTIAKLPKFTLEPQQYLIFCRSADTALFKPLGNTLGISPIISLVNTESIITLKNKEGNLVDLVHYTDKFYQDSQKKNGGWSLELINPDLACQFDGNWIASNSEMGGTPGKQNSVLNKNQIPQISIKSLQIVNDKRIKLIFSNHTSLFNNLTEDNFLIEKFGKAQQVQLFNADSIYLDFEKDIPKNKRLSLKIETINYCDQLVYQDSIPFFHGSPIQNNDILISEVLFNPKEDGVDFVEIYNNSNKDIDLRNLQIATNAKGIRQSIKNIADSLQIIEPDQYIALSSNSTILKNHYPSTIEQNCVQLNSFPSYPNEQGIVLLLSNKNLIDSFSYNSNMHQPFLNNPKGISLERQSFEKEANEPNNFQSSATIGEGSTPGYKNSRILLEEIKKNNFFLESKTMSPNGDNFEDELRINYQIFKNDMMINLIIFDEFGRTINRLIRNKSVGNEGTITWDGKDEKAQISPSGLYVYFIEIYDNKGFISTFKGGFALINKESKN